MLYNKEVVREAMVDALDDGRIVRVPESYAKREGLPIIRRFSSDNREKIAAETTARKIEDVKVAPFETLRKPLRNKNNVLASLKENFHWEICKKRRLMNLTRKQVADAISASEYEVKMIENGVLPTDDFILVSKVEKYYGIGLRKDSVGTPVVKDLRHKKEETKKEIKNEKISDKDAEDLFKADDLLADEIEIEK